MRARQKKEVSNSLGFLAKTSFVVFIGLAISKLLTYVYRVVAAREFGPEAYGLFSLALIASGWIIAFASFGIPEGVLRYVALYRGKKQDDRARYIVRYGLSFLSITSIIGGILLFLLAKPIAVNIFHSTILIPFIQIFSLSVPLTAIAVVLLNDIKANEKIGDFSLIYNVSQNVAKVVLLLILVYLGFGIHSISISYIFGLVVVLVLAFWYVNKRLNSTIHGREISKEDKSPIRKELVRYSMPLLFYGILVNALYWIDSMSLGYFKDPTIVGIYNAAVPIALLLSIAPELFIQLFSPMIARYYGAREIGVIRELTKQVTKWIWVINLPILALLIAFPEAVLNILFGSEFISAAPALRVLSVSALIGSLGYSSMSLVGMSGKSNLVLMNIGIAALVNFVLNTILVPMKNIAFLDNSNGIIGAALATVIAVMVFNSLFFIQARKILKTLPFRRKMLNALSALIIPLSILIYAGYIVDNPGIFEIILYALVFSFLYVVLAFAMKALDKNDIEIIKKIYGRIKSKV